MTYVETSRPGVSLHVLGGLAVRRDDEPPAGLLSQRKRVGLLVYLTLRRVGGAVTRDELLGVFWPESTESRARASLRQALRFLRGHLGPHVLLNRGDAGVMVDLDTMACDAVGFWRAIQAGHDATAIRIYSGELLPGFVVSGSWEFDLWLQGERQRFRTEAVQAALRLAAGARELGELPRAAEHLRWALEQSPTDESIVRDLMSLLDRMGNRAEAVAVFEALAERLEAELELEPSSKTVLLSEAVRTGTRSGTAADLRGGSAGEEPSPQRVLVLGIEAAGDDPGLQSLARLAADTLAQGLASIPDVEVVPPLALGASGGPPVEPEDLAHRAGAGTVVVGALHVVGDALHAGIQVTDVIHGRLMEAPTPVVGKLSDALAVVRELRDRAMTLLAPALTSRVVHVREAVPPPSIEAYREYVDGLACFVRGEWEAALRRLRKSVEMEADYALPRVVSAISLWNLGRLEEARSTTVEARKVDEGLGKFERAILDIVEAWLDGDWAAAYTAARVQADMAPGSIPHFQVAEEARRLNRPREAREVLSRLDPESGELRGWIHYWIEVTTACHLMGDHRRELELAHRCRRLHPDDPGAALTEIRALAALGRVEDVERLLADILGRPGNRAPSPGVLLREAALELRAHADASGATGPGSMDAQSRDLMDRAVAWFREQSEADRSDASRRQLARTLYLAGSLEEARELFREIVDPGAGVRAGGEHHGHLHGHLDQGFLAVIAAVLGDTEDTERWSRSLADLDGPFLYGAPWFWLAAVAAVEGEKDQAVTHLRRAFAEGMPHGYLVHTDPHLLKLRGYVPFDRLLRPRG
jgi:DNA-binding SARP family transcriptional activator